LVYSKIDEAAAEVHPAFKQGVTYRASPRSTAADHRLRGERVDSARGMWHADWHARHHQPDPS